MNSGTNANKKNNPFVVISKNKNEAVPALDPETSELSRKCRTI
jgi:hypothetical protein